MTQGLGILEFLGQNLEFLAIKTRIPRINLEFPKKYPHTPKNADKAREF